MRDLDANERRVLHCAVDRGDAPFDLVELLVRLWPDAAQVRDRLGYLPFRIAASKVESLDVAYLLARVRPDVVGLGCAR